MENLKADEEDKDQKEWLFQLVFDVLFGEVDNQPEFSVQNLEEF